MSHQINDRHVDAVCGPGKGAGTCAFLTVGSGWFCAKQTIHESLLRSRAATGAMRARSENCSGFPDFRPHPEPIRLDQRDEAPR